MAKMFLTDAETQEILNKNSQELKQLTREGRLREFRDGPRLMFKADQVMALAETLVEPEEASGDLKIEIEPVDIEVAEIPALETSDLEALNTAYQDSRQADEIAFAAAWKSGSKGRQMALLLGLIFKDIISEQQLNTLKYACEYHDKGLITDDPTVGCCWDADRLDLMRVQTTPDPKYLSTAYGKTHIWNI